MIADLFTPSQYQAIRNAVAGDTDVPNSNSIIEWLDTLPIKIIVADSKGKADFWNKQWYDYTGLPMNYPKNKLLKASLHPDDVERTFNGMFYSVNTGSELQMEYRLKRAIDGQYRWHLARAISLKDNDSNIVKWLVAVTDIHEQKEAENCKDIFLSVASHELKTPITALKTLLHLYKSEVMADNDACPNMLEQAENQLMRIERLVGNLLDISKMNAHKMVYRFEEFNFGDMVQESLARIQLQSAQHTIVLAQNAKLLFVGDKLRLEQVLNNLLSNAVKYSPQASTIIVRSYIVQNELYVSVQDFGIGIAPEQTEQIFTAYYRVNNTSTACQGLGIGLYICSEIVKNHHGKLWVQSIPAQGSTFYFKLPINSLINFGDE